MTCSGLVVSACLLLWVLVVYYDMQWVSGVRLFVAVGSCGILWHAVG